MPRRSCRPHPLPPTAGAADGAGEPFRRPDRLGAMMCRAPRRSWKQRARWNRMSARSAPSTSMRSPLIGIAASALLRPAAVSPIPARPACRAYCPPPISPRPSGRSRRPTPTGRVLSRSHAGPDRGVENTGWLWLAAASSWSIGPKLVAPLFKGELLRAQLAQVHAQMRQVSEQYTLRGAGRLPTGGRSAVAARRSQPRSRPCAGGGRAPPARSTCRWRWTARSTTSKWRSRRNSCWPAGSGDHASNPQATLWIRALGGVVGGRIADEIAVSLRKRCVSRLRGSLVLASGGHLPFGVARTRLSYATRPCAPFPRAACRPFEVIDPRFRMLGPAQRMDPARHMLKGRCTSRTAITCCGATSPTPGSCAVMIAPHRDAIPPTQGHHIPAISLPQCSSCLTLFLRSHAQLLGRGANPTTKARDVPTTNPTPCAGSHPEGFIPFTSRAPRQPVARHPIRRATPNMGCPRKLRNSPNATSPPGPHATDSPSSGRRKSDGTPGAEKMKVSGPLHTTKVSLVLFGDAHRGEGGNDILPVFRYDRRPCGGEPRAGLGFPP